MPDNFTFTAGDAIVTRYLTGTEIGQIVTQQVSTEYTFEFHGGHTTGYPIYIRPNGNTDGSNIPKIDTRNKAATDYNTIQKIANSGKLTASLNQTTQTEILNIIRTDWLRLQNLANRYWTNSPVPVPVPVPVVVQSTIPCSFTGCGGTVPLLLDAITKKRKKAACDTCFTFQ